MNGRTWADVWRCYTHITETMNLIFGLQIEKAFFEAIEQLFFNYSFYKPKYSRFFNAKRIFPWAHKKRKKVAITDRSRCFSVSSIHRQSRMIGMGVLWMSLRNDVMCRSISQSKYYDIQCPLCISRDIESKIFCRGI